jgi:hypothetical protein
VRFCEYAPANLQRVPENFGIVSPLSGEKDGFPGV